MEFIVNFWSFFFLSVASCDAPQAWQFGFQDPASPIAQGIQDLHNDISFFMVVVLVFVVWMLLRTLWHFHWTKNPVPSKIIHGTFLEIVWTVTPRLSQFLHLLFFIQWMKLLIHLSL